MTINKQKVTGLEDITAFHVSFPNEPADLPFLKEKPVDEVVGFNFV